MVIADADAPRNTNDAAAPGPARPFGRGAPPLHRLAAVVFDVGVVLAPIQLLLAAPLKRMVTLDLVTGGERAALVSVALAALSVVIHFVYQTFTHYRFGRTLGQRVLGLHVVGVRGRLDRALTRALAWHASVFLLGLPFLAVFSHRRRQPLYDRLAETTVRTRGLGVGAPGVGARKVIGFCYGLTALGLIVAMGAGLAEVWRAPGEILDLAAPECEAVSRFDDQAPGGDDHRRLTLGLTLYAAGLVDRTCLANEVDREVAVQTPGVGVTLLAQAFVNSDDPEVSNAYLDRPCRDDSRSAECAMSRVVNAWSAGDWAGVDQALIPAHPGAPYLEVWAIRHLMKQARFGEALAQLDALFEHAEVAEFLLDQRVRALYGAGRTAEARVAYEQALPTLDPEVATELSANACLSELRAGCVGASRPACARELRAPTEATPLQILARVRRDECKSNAPIDYSELAEAAPDRAWQRLYTGSDRVIHADRAGAVTAFRAVIADADAPEPARIEAVRRVAMLVTPAEAEGVLRDWLKWDGPAARIEAGHYFRDLLRARGETVIAATVSEYLPNAAPPTDAAGVPDVELRRPASADHE